MGPQAKLEAPDSLPQPQTSYVDLGVTLLKQNRTDLARDAFIRSLRVEGVSGAALSGAGVAAERQGLLNEARDFFQKARDLAPESVLAHNNLGAVHYRLGDFHAARRSFQAAFALSSGKNRVAAKNLGMAELAIEREAERNPTEAPNPIPVKRLGSSVYQLGTDDTTEREG
ncbi:MAG: tetratricopeptide repeat protein [Pseudomonadota bacterium]